MRSSRINFDPAPSAASHLLVGPSSRRVGLVIFPPSGDIVTLTNDQPAVLQKGITLTQTMGPLVMCIDDYGDAIQKEWWIIQSVGTNPTAFLEILG